jgi:hypothetical protein
VHYDAPDSELESAHSCLGQLHMPMHGQQIVSWIMSTELPGIVALASAWAGPNRTRAAADLRLASKSLVHRGGVGVRRAASAFELDLILGMTRAFIDPGSRSAIVRDELIKRAWAPAAGTSGLASAIATRLTGSPDIFTAQWDSGMPGDLAAGTFWRGPLLALGALVRDG